MGGSAFAKEGIQTTRIPPDVYFQTRDRLIATLREHFKYADSPIEAPEKKDHGDIDILVAEPLKPENELKLEDLAHVVGARHWKRTTNSATSHFALPWHEEDNPNPRTSRMDTNSIETSLEHEFSSFSLSPPAPRYIQLDIHICPNFELFRWLLFLHAHGDLWNMLGSVLRRHGLTCTELGLLIRIAELESYSRSQSRVFVTRNPEEFLQFLELDSAVYWQRFASLNAMMDFAASCRFHDPVKGSMLVQNEGEVAMKLKANDRQRMEKREAFRYWVEVYLPEHSGQEKGRSADLSREEVLNEVKVCFGGDFEERFERQKRDVIQSMERDRMWAAIRRDVGLEGKKLGKVMGRLKDVVEERKAGNDIIGIEDVRSAYMQGNFKEVQVWACNNWARVVELI